MNFVSSVFFVGFSYRFELNAHTELKKALFYNSLCFNFAAVFFNLVRLKMLDAAQTTEIFQAVSASHENDVFSFSSLIEPGANALQNAIESAVFLCEQIPTLHKYGYLDKKIALILKALKGIQISRTHAAEWFVKICNPAREGRVLSLDSGVYKKGRDFLREALVWELSVILGCDQFIVPSLPIFIHGSEATFQPFFSVSSMARFIQDGQEMSLKIPLEDYWILALFTFLIGHSDLNGDNLHFNQNGYILIDNDCSFPSINKPVSLDGRSLSVPFQNVLFDFDCSQEKLSGVSYQRVIAILNDWKSREKDLEKFFSLSPLVQRRGFEMCEQAFWERWRKILDAKLFPETDLRAFIQTIFPEHFKQIDIAQKLASKILGLKAGPMSALHLLGAFIRYCPVDPATYTEVYKWISSNHVY